MSIVKIGSKVKRVTNQHRGMLQGEVDYVVGIEYDVNQYGITTVIVELLRFGKGHMGEGLKVIETDNEPNDVANHHYYLLWKEGVDVQFECEGRWANVLDLEDFSFNVDAKFRIKPDNSNKIQKLRLQLEAVTNELKLLESE